MQLWWRRDSKLESFIATLLAGRPTCGAMMTLSIDVAIIGAGPYGLSLAAHLDHQKVDYRIFGKPMAPWKDNMPSGMLLKSYPWASNLSDPHSQFTVRQYCFEQEMPYHDTLM